MAMDTATMDRRTGTDRRSARISFRYPERRTGFDRRDPSASAWSRIVAAYRGRPALIAACVAATVALGAADLLLTWRLLGLGVGEVNPVMARIFEGGLASAAIFKGGITIALAAGIWMMRRYRRVLELSLVVPLVMAVVVGYEIAILVMLSG